jgi:hypothetical protein
MIMSPVMMLRALWTQSQVLASLRRRPSDREEGLENIRSPPLSPVVTGKQIQNRKKSKQRKKKVSDLPGFASVAKRH